MEIDITYDVPTPPYRLPHTLVAKTKRGAKPSGDGKTGRPRQYPFDKMRVGASFLVPAKQAASVRTCVFTYRVNHNPKFRAILRKDKKMVRVFCVRA